jgi:uncharacterized tellurite resistance protein B-like protein
VIDRVLDFLSGRATPAAAAGRSELELAVAALLIEAERMDDRFDAAERRTIERLLAARFGLAPDAVRTLVARAEAAVRDSTQLFPFTRTIVAAMAPEDRAQILELMWAVAYADGTLDPHEDMLLRRIAGLLHVPDRDRALARQRAIEKAKGHET